jgi:thiol-disulfide isomerase/thioredoxin
MASAGVALRAEGRMPSLDGATGWLNTEPLTPAALRGRVVLVQFWTYTCINWLRTLTQVRAWSERYRDDGLVVLGVHTPEFSFERDVRNIRRAVEEMRIGYPVAIDSDYGVWEAFGNHYWPALYFVDAEGRIRHHQFGEGDFEESERVLQQLLAETGADVVGQPLVQVAPTGLEAPADWADLRSGETYLGHGRTDDFASPEGLAPDVRRSYTLPESLRLNSWALGGSWTVESESALLEEAGGRIAYRFSARDLHLVLAPDPWGTSVPFRVRLDGRPPGEAAGDDVDAHGDGVVTEQRLHQLIRQPPPIGARTFEIEFLAPGVRGVVFTFG